MISLGFGKANVSLLWRSNHEVIKVVLLRNIKFSDEQAHPQFDGTFSLAI